MGGRQVLHFRTNQAGAEAAEDVIESGKEGISSGIPGKITIRRSTSMTPALAATIFTLGIAPSSLRTCFTQATCEGCQDMESLGLPRFGPFSPTSKVGVINDPQMGALQKVFDPKKQSKK
jgi:hypothetical protein